MKNKVYFSDSNDPIRLDYYTPSGECQSVYFNNTSGLLDYCRTNGIEVTLANCITEG